MAILFLAPSGSFRPRTRSLSPLFTHGLLTALAARRSKTHGRRLGEKDSVWRGHPAARGSHRTRKVGGRNQRGFARLSALLQRDALFRNHNNSRHGKLSAVVLQLRQEVASGHVLGPRIYCVGAMIDAADPAWPDLAYAISSRAQIPGIVERDKRAGVDLLKGLRESFGPHVASACGASA